MRRAAMIRMTLYELGIAYSTGTRAAIEVDLIEAHKWFNLAVGRRIAAPRRNAGPRSPTR